MRRVRRVLILGMAAATLFGAAACLFQLAIALPAPGGEEGADDGAAIIVFFLGVSFGLSAFAVVGVLLVWHREHPMGWVFGTVGSGLGLGFAAGVYVTVAEVNDGLPLVPVVAWFANWLLVPSLAGGVVALLLLFPSGHLPSRRWRTLGWLAVAVQGLWIIGMMFEPRLRDAGSIPSPLPVTLPTELADTLVSIGSTLYAPVLIGSIAAAAQRHRAARGVERQQLKWFTFAAAITAVGFTALFVSSLSTTLEPIGQIGWLVGMLGLSLIPAAAGIAILRHGLYDIDLLINRTVVYGALTATLAAAYVGAIALFQVGLREFTQESQLAVAASTLLVAALFQPLRAGIQRVVDRRFYRRKYDAAKTLEKFGARLRSQVDLEALRAEVVAAARETVQPRQASLWLREVGR
jgi:hypothetical protein